MRETTMRMVAGALLAAATALLAGCQKSLSFEEHYMNREKDGSARNPVLLDTIVTSGYVVALGTSASDNDPASPGALVYRILDDGWELVNGTTCEGGPARVGYKEVNVFCGTLDTGRADVASVLVERAEVRYFPDGERRIWYAASDSNSFMVHLLNSAGDTVREFDTSGRRP